MQKVLALCVARQVQTDQNVSTEDLQVEIRELDKHLEALEQRGVELEGNLRDTKNGSAKCSFLFKTTLFTGTKPLFM